MSDKSRTILAWIFVVPVVLISLGCAVYFRAFRTILLIFTGAFSGLQIVAMIPWRHRDIFYKCTDYVYYFAIAGVVGLGARYAPQAHQFLVLSAIEQQTSDLQRSKEIDSELLELTHTQEAVKAAEKDKAFMSECIEAVESALRMAPSGSSPANRGIVTPYTSTSDPLCNVYLGESYEILKVPTIKKEKDEIDARAKILENLINEPPAKSDTTEAKVDPDALEREFFFVPLILVIGVATKLGKTTCALLTSKSADGACGAPLEPRQALSRSGTHGP